MAGAQDYFYITDGEHNRRLKSGAAIPHGWKAGKTQLRQHARRFSNAQVADALCKAHGIQVEAARLLEETYKRPCRRQLIHSYVHRNPELRAIIDEGMEEMLDLAEGNVFKAVEAGNENMTKFLLATRGKDRGYTYRQENQALGADGTPVNPVGPQVIIYVPDNGRDPEMVDKYHESAKPNGHDRSA
jgi:hypothetical protein